MAGYGDRQCSHHDVCDLFGKVQLERYPVQPKVCKLVKKIKDYM